MESLKQPTEKLATMRLDGLISGHRSPYDGQYLVEYDPDIKGIDPDGRPMLCHLSTTPDREQALRLPKVELLELWRKVSTRWPKRPDGKPNRPLTAYTVTIE